MNISLRIGLENVNFSASRLEKMVANIGIKNSATKMSFYTRFIDIFYRDHKEETLNALYDTLMKSIDNKRFRDEGVNKFMVFCTIRDLAIPDKQHEFKVHITREKTEFLIAGVPIFRSECSNVCNDFIERFLNKNNGTIDKTEIVKQLAEKDESLAADTIQRFFRDYRERVAQAKNKAMANGESFATMTYHNLYSKNNGRRYYHDTICSKEERFPVLYAPVAVPQKELKGASKHVEAIDKRFVALAPNEPELDAYCFDRADNDKARKLAELGLRSVKYGVVIDKHMMIARNAGPTLTHVITDNYTVVQKNAFQQAARDLSVLHKQGIYLRDIKLDNMAYDGNTTNFIDVDDRISVSREYKTPIYTPYAFTKGLREGAYKMVYGENHKLLEKVNGYTFLRAADEYAFLLAMIAATTENKDLRNAVMNPDVDENNGKFPGAMHPDNKSIFDDWISEHVKPEFHSKVEQLLTNPAQLATVSPDREYLIDMLLFDDPVPQVDGYCASHGACF